MPTFLGPLVVFSVLHDCPQLFIDLVSLSHLTQLSPSLVHLAPEHQPAGTLGHEEKPKEHDQRGKSCQTQHEPEGRDEETINTIIVTVEPL